MSDVSQVEQPTSALATIMQRAPELGRRPDRAAAADELIQLARGDRVALTEARQALVGRLHAHSDDHDATAGLLVINRALARLGWVDPYCWKNRRKP
ncbi:MAG TPA: hypothetical protein VKU91_05725 [Acidimicrobiales bacterium]|nr:hypothetical protein [Acidimicrobiales bacterium]